MAEREKVHKRRPKLRAEQLGKAKAAGIPSSLYQKTTLEKCKLVKSEPGSFVQMPGCLFFFTLERDF